MLRFTPFCAAALTITTAAIGQTGMSTQGSGSGSPDTGYTAGQTPMSSSSGMNSSGSSSMNRSGSRSSHATRSRSRSHTTNPGMAGDTGMNSTSQGSGTNTGSGPH